MRDGTSDCFTNTNGPADGTTVARIDFDDQNTVECDRVRKARHTAR